MDVLSDTFDHVACLECGHTMPASLTTAECDKCGSAWLDARYNYKIIKQRWPDVVKQRETSLWRYAELLPVHYDARVSMVEGWTPIFKAERLGEALGHNNIYIKDERRGPTNSFKDRQASLAVSAMAAAGIKEAVIASTGNAATSYAAYCARAGVKLWVFVTSLVPSEKMREISLYGAEVIKVTGTYDQAKVVASNFAQRHNLHYERGAKAIVGKESMKTLAYEIAEGLGWRSPDWFIQAVSGGLGPIGVWKGFTELREIGLVDTLPRLGIVQVEGCAPMVHAFAADSDTAEPIEPRTAITVLSTGAPGFAYTYLYRATKQGGGTMVAVSDDDAFKWMRRLARLEGISVEPATAVAFAGLAKMVEDGDIKPDQTVVVNCSGHTMPVEKFILSDQQVVDIAVKSPLADHWGLLPEEGLGAALEFLDEKVTSVVVIDDSPHDSRLIRRLLQRHKAYRVFEANDPREGLELVIQKQPDLVVMDLMMPGVTGFDLMDELKSNELTAHIPIIVVSAKTLTDRERSHLEKQTASFWVKGAYKTQDLVSHIVETLDGEPLEEISHYPPADSSLAGMRPITQGGQQGQYDILLVEDNPLDGRLLRRTLEGKHLCNVHEAQTGELALDMLAHMTPDLIIMDLMLPDMTGIDLLERMQDQPSVREVPIILLTAKDLTVRERKILESRVDKTLTKGTLERTVLQKEIMSMFEGDKSP